MALKTMVKQSLLMCLNASFYLACPKINILSTFTHLHVIPIICETQKRIFVKMSQCFVHTIVNGV